MMIAETASPAADPRTPAWMAGAAKWIRHHTLVHAVSYFDSTSPKGYNFEVDVEQPHAGGVPGLGPAPLLRRVGTPMILRPLAAADAAELLRILQTPEVARWWDAPDEGFPLTDDPDATRLVIEVDGAVAGMIQFAEELEPKYRHASIDLFLDPALHGRGLGTEAVRRGGAPPDRRARPPPHHDRPGGGERRGDPRLREGRLPAGRRSCAATSATSAARAGTTAC